MTASLGVRIWTHCGQALWAPTVLRAGQCRPGRGRWLCSLFAVDQKFGATRTRKGGGPHPDCPLLCLPPSAALQCGNALPGHSLLAQASFQKERRSPGITRPERRPRPGRVEWGPPSLGGDLGGGAHAPHDRRKRVRSGFAFKPAPTLSPLQDSAWRFNYLPRP